MQRLDEITPQMIPIELIDEPLQRARINTLEQDIQRLAASIRLRGLQQPVGLRIIEDGRYRIVWGDRRVGAHVLLDLPTVSAKCFECTDEEEHELLITENSQRVQLDPIEEAHTYKYEHETLGKTWAQIAMTHEFSASYVSTLVKMLDLPEDAQKAICRGDLTKAQALECLQAKNTTMLNAMLDAAINGKSSAWQLKVWREHKEKVGEDVQLHEAVEAAIANRQPMPEPGERCYCCHKHFSFTELQWMYLCEEHRIFLLHTYRHDKFLQEQEEQEQQQ